MPYRPEHKAETRARIVENARLLFNRHGYDKVTIDMVMEAASLTRGGFYSHFRNKQELFAAAVSSFLMGRGARWRAEAGVDPIDPGLEDAASMLRSYLSPAHLGELEGQCPMIALPSDIARAEPQVQTAYQELLKAMIGLYERSIPEPRDDRRTTALALAALSVGGMVLARTIPDAVLAAEVREAAFEKALAMLSPASDGSQRIR
ncbi:TetR family transcriptional regulator [Bradyrhizobium sp. SSBR45G]|uniref:TetR/AcrR family transcriptional regulator n=1 Tax=unclassified Bradyrhizobium TaxID=2631580 RepID=UPI002342BC9E|nr:MULTISPECIES: TetR/AcrR family transcriptional regulator [unclassified Bradyrhizobium]GLH76613.1 TetR family transcriptional regulator [Bradyrhizobium sp. SSBR45G]GLH84230.1 TetR family transcriptional regulator [Bradyrhizobium sp. SSBR45R]